MTERASARRGRHQPAFDQIPDRERVLASESAASAAALLGRAVRYRIPVYLQHFRQPFYPKLHKEVVDALSHGFAKALPG